MKERLVALVAPAAKVEVVPNWVDPKEISPHPRDNAWAREHGLAGRFVVMHAGNVGLLQDIETFVDAAKLAPEVTCVIVGEGAGRAELERRAAEIGAANVRFIDRQPRASLNLVLASADAHLVSLMSGLGGLMEPSKLYGILAAGRPVLAAIEPGSEPARVVGEISCGVSAPPASPEALAAAMNRLRKMPAEEIERMGEVGRGYAERSCVRARSTGAYAAMLSALGA
jgi:colanic acid biosynthesis glycosyl transferase WcaI